MMMKRRASLLLVAVLAAGAPGMAAEPVGMVEKPCPPPLAMPPELEAQLRELFMKPRTLQPGDFGQLAGNPAFAAYEKANRERAASDWAGLCRYSAANEALAATRPQVVLMGDSITENWLMADPGFFGTRVVNRGIGGQTSAQMLVRFRADVIALRPQAVHILAGTNDVAGNNGPTSPQNYRNNIMSMVELARANGIRVILGAIPPADRFTWRPGLEPVPLIRELNQWLRDYAKQNGLGFIDYHAPLAGAAQELRADLGNDGVHPNAEGYRIMRRLAEAAF